MFFVIRKKGMMIIHMQHVAFFKNFLKEVHGGSCVNLLESNNMIYLSLDQIGGKKS